MTVALDVAVRLHSGLCLAWLALGYLVVRRQVLVRVVETGPGAADWGEAPLTGIFLAATGLWILWGQLFLNQHSTWAHLLD